MEQSEGQHKDEGNKDDSEILNEMETSKAKYELKRNNELLQKIIGMSTWESLFEKKVTAHKKMTVEESTKSVYVKELSKKENSIGELRCKIIALETCLNEKVTGIQSKSSELHAVKEKCEFYEKQNKMKEQEITELKSLYENITVAFAVYRKERENDETKFLSEKEKLIKKHEKELHKLQEELTKTKAIVKTETKTKKTLELTLSNLTVEIEKEWNTWFEKYKEKPPQDLSALYEKIKRSMEYEWTEKKKIEIRKKVEKENEEKISKLERKVFQLEGVLSEVHKYSEILQTIWEKRKTTVNVTATSNSYTETSSYSHTNEFEYHEEDDEVD